MKTQKQIRRKEKTNLQEVKKFSPNEVLLSEIVTETPEILLCNEEEDVSIITRFTNKIQSLFDKESTTRNKTHNQSKP